MHHERPRSASVSVILNILSHKTDSETPVIARGISVSFVLPKNLEKLAQGWSQKVLVTPSDPETLLN